MAVSSIWASSKPSPPQLALPISHSTLIGNLRYDLDKCHKWECCGMAALAQRAITTLEDDKPNVTPLVHSSGASDRVRQNDSKGFHKDLNLLPSESYHSSPSPQNLIFMFNRIQKILIPIIAM